VDSKAIEKLADSLRKGELPAAQPWDIAAAVRWIADALARPDSKVSVGEARAAAKVLNQRRHFDHTRMLGQAWTDTRGFDATVARHHAQAEINLSALDAAEKMLREGLAKIKQPGAGAQATAEIPEYEGLLGRTYKQRFAFTGDKDCLVQATNQYLVQYEGNPARPFWHGINVAALVAREEREGLSPRATVSSEKLATAVFDHVTSLYRKGGSDQWVAATASEASLALDNCEDAELWLYRFLHHSKVQPFDLESYGRQLREIWQGDATAGGGCADRLTAIMERHIARTERRWSIQAPAISSMAEALKKDQNAFEKNFSGEACFSVDALKRMLDACSSIGCVCNPAGRRLGTGFLLSGNWLKDSFRAAPVFVTNAHVISETVPKAIPPQEVRVTFEVESASFSEPRFYGVTEVLYTSPPGDLGVRDENGDKLDVTIVRLGGLSDTLGRLNAAMALPLVDPTTKAFVVGHPLGSGLQISLHDSVLLDIDDDERLVHYRTPTDPGSSGSPVFNVDWEVIAVHHGGSSETPRLRGDGRYEANEGIALSAVRRKLNA
jgi:V8-like Glu-specific endopeptidase